MKTKRIIPCLDVKDGRVVKGINFENLVDAGDPAEIAALYNESLADELVFLDITASTENRKTMVDVVSKTVKRITIPLTVGGGIASLSDIERVLAAGASKVSINSAAVKTPNLIKEAVEKFGKERIVVAIDVKKKESGGYDVVINGGQISANIDVIEWAKKVEVLGAGAILLTSMDYDGTKEGYDIEITKRVAEAVKIPVIASGGAGKKEDFKDVLTDGLADAALAASLFHFKELLIPELKEYLKSEGIAVNTNPRLIGRQQKATEC